MRAGRRRAPDGAIRLSRERLGSDGAVVAEAFDAEQASIGSEDARVLVVHMQRRDDPVGNDAGAIPRGGASADAPVEDQLHVVGSSHVEVLAHHLLEEDPSGHRPVEDLDARKFGLQHRDVIADALLPVRASVVCCDRISATDRATFMARAPVDGLPIGQSMATAAIVRLMNAASRRRGSSGRSPTRRQQMARPTHASSRNRE